MVKWNRVQALMLSSGIILACTSGGISGRQWAMALPAMDNGEPVLLSLFGERFFFIVGCVAAVSVASYILGRLKDRLSHPAITTSFFIASPIVGLVAAPVAIMALCCAFVTIPREVFELLFDSAATPI